jgi:exodeoxyribonuclease-3
LSSIVIFLQNVDIQKVLGINKLSKMTKIISWNVNGIRSLLRKDLWYPFVNRCCPDIICLQEVRADQTQFDFSDEFNTKYRYQTFNKHFVKKGYSGTAILSKIEPIKTWTPEFDKEGRIIVAEYNDYMLVCVYVPNAGSRFEYRVNEWDILFRNFVSTFEKPVIICGDFNVAVEKIDIYNPKIKNVAGVTIMEKYNFGKLLETFVDSYRKKNPETIKFSWWSNMYKSRSKNHGWRIDYFLVSNSLTFHEADILDSVMGSDHAPVLLVI